jgi:hypothetical protein
MAFRLDAEIGGNDSPENLILVNCCYATLQITQVLIAASQL